MKTSFLFRLWSTNTIRSTNPRTIAQYQLPSRHPKPIALSSKNLDDTMLDSTQKLLRADKRGKQRALFLYDGRDYRRRILRAAPFLSLTHVSVLPFLRQVHEVCESIWLHLFSIGTRRIIFGLLLFRRI